MTIKLAINACRARSGGAQAHLIGVLTSLEHKLSHFGEVHVWSYPQLLQQLPDCAWLVKHSTGHWSGSVLKELFWEYFIFKDEFTKFDCQIALNVDAGTLSRVVPSVTMSRDMLAFEPGESARYGISLQALRQFFLRRLQLNSLRKSAGAIYLTRYAKSVIESVRGPSKYSKIIPHGVSSEFRKNADWREYRLKKSVPVNALYISPIWLFKHQWHVVSAVALLRSKGYDIKLTLVGGGDRVSLRKLERQISLSDPDGEFVSLTGSVQHKDIPGLMCNADLFIFASSCENMPNSLIEAMNFGLPIACSNRGPMPEVLQDGGVIFDPESPVSISDAIETMYENAELVSSIRRRALQLSKAYSWSRCATETFDFVLDVWKREQGHHGDH